MGKFDLCDLIGRKEQEIHELLYLQLVLATKIRAEAKSLGLHGACWVLAMRDYCATAPFSDAKTVFKELGFANPTLVVIGHSYKEHFADTNEYENYIGVGAAKIAKMLETKVDSSIIPDGYITAEGENDYRGGKVYQIAGYIILAALSSNEPEKNDDIVDAVVKGFFNSRHKPGHEVAQETDSNVMEAVIQASGDFA